MSQTVESAKENVVTPVIERVDHAGDFSRLMLEALDETLRLLFNESAVGAIHFYLEKLCNLPREAVAENPEAFSAGLQKLMGQGAIVVENMILKSLYVKLDLALAEEEGYKFEDYVNELKAKFGNPQEKARKTVPGMP